MKYYKILVLSLAIVLIAIVGGAAYWFAGSERQGAYVGESSRSLIAKGKEYIFDKDKPDSALSCFSVVVSRFDPGMDINEKKLVIEAYNRLWYLYFFVYFDYAEASGCLKKAMDISVEEGLSKERVDLNYGCMYQLINEQNPDSVFSRLSSSYLRKALTEADEADNEDVRQYAMANLLALIADNQCPGDISTEWIAFCENTRNKDADIFRFNSAVYEIISKINVSDYANAIALTDRLLNTLNFEGDSIRCCIILLRLKAKAFYLSRRYDEAFDTLKRLEKLAYDNGLTDSRMESSRVMSEYLYGMGKDSLAYEYKVKNLMLKDSILNSRQLAKINELQFFSEIKDIKSELTVAHFREKIAMYILGGTILIVLLSVIFIIVLWNKNKKLDESNRSLYKKNEELVRQESRYKKADDATENNDTSAVTKYSGSSIGNEDKEIILNKVKNILAASEEIYSEDFCMARLAVLTGIKEKLLSQVINELAGCNFSSLVNHFRINEACRRISDQHNYENLTLEAIGNSVGFKSRSTFIAAFKCQTGLTPSEYKRQARAEM